MKHLKEALHKIGILQESGGTYLTTPFVYYHNNTISLFSFFNQIKFRFYLYDAFHTRR